MWVGSTLFVGCAGPSFAPFSDCDALAFAFAEPFAAVAPVPLLFPVVVLAFGVVVLRFFATRSSCEESTSDPERGSCPSSEGVSTLRLDEAARFGGIMCAFLRSEGGTCADMNGFVWNPRGVVNLEPSDTGTVVELVPPRARAINRGEVGVKLAAGDRSRRKVV